MSAALGIFLRKVSRLLPKGRCRTDKLHGVIKHRSSHEPTMVGRGASLHGRLFLGGTDGSNPVPSSGESGELPYCAAGLVPISSNASLNCWPIT